MLPSMIKTYPGTTRAGELQRLLLEPALFSCMSKHIGEPDALIKGQVRVPNVEEQDNAVKFLQTCIGGAIILNANATDNWWCCRLGTALSTGGIPTESNNVPYYCVLPSTQAAFQTRGGYLRPKLPFAHQQLYHSVVGHCSERAVGGVLATLYLRAQNAGQLMHRHGASKKRHTRKGHRLSEGRIPQSPVGFQKLPGNSKQALIVRLLW